MLVNPARQLEHLVEAVLAQQLYAIEFAWGFTLLERHLDALTAPPHPDLAHKLAGAVAGLRESLQHVRRFTEEADLGALDRGLAGARAQIFVWDELKALARLLEQPEEFFVSDSLERPWQEQWEATVTRHQGESRAVFSCRTCGWEFTFVQEVDSAEELEVPFAELSCPLCEAGSPSSDEDCAPESPPVSCEP